MTSVLTIDPGATECACVYSVATVLQHALFTNTPAHDADVVIVECMQADERTIAIDIRYLLACQANGHRAAGFAEGRGAQLISVTPTEWKGSEQKPIQHKRAWAAMAPAEREIFGGAATERAILKAVEKGALRRWHIAGADCYPRAFVMHNLLDAAAMNLIYTGRLEKLG